MASILDESDIESVCELLDVVFGNESDAEAVAEALQSLKILMELEEPTVDSDDEQDTSSTDRVVAIKQHILTTKPNFFEFLIKMPNNEDAEAEMAVALPKAELVAEMLRNFPRAKIAFSPFIGTVLQPFFHHDPDDGTYVQLVRGYMARYPIAELLRHDSAAGDINRITKETLSEKIKSFSELLSPDLSASSITSALVKRQEALAHALMTLAETPLKPDAVPSFIETGALDALLSIIARGALSAPDMENPNESVDEACGALYALMEHSASEELAQALVKRQAVGPLLRQMTYICTLDGTNGYNTSSIPRTLVGLSSLDEELRIQIIAEAQTIAKSNPKNLGPGAPIVLGEILKAAAMNGLDEEVEPIMKSKDYIPFFLDACEPGANDNTLEIVGDALYALVPESSSQLRKAISKPQQVEKFMNLVEYACSQSAADISPTFQVLRELVLPSDTEDTGGWTSTASELKRLNKNFCVAFAKVVKARCDAARALATELPEGEENETVIEEPCKEGIAHMKNVKMLSVIIEEQYITLALTTEGLLEYLQYMVFSPSPLTRRAALELLSALTHDSSLAGDFAYVPDLIDAFKGVAVHLLDDPRALIRALSMQWLVRIMSYRHPNGETEYRYKPAVDFVMEHVAEEKLVEMLNGTSDEVTVAASMIEAMARHSTDPEVRERLKNNQGLLKGLWNGVFWDWEKAPEIKDEDINEEFFVNGNVDVSSGEALTHLLDPLIDRASITEHIAPHMAQHKEKEPAEFAQFLTTMPAVTSLAVLSPEAGVLSTVGKMISNEEQLPFAMTALRHLAQGSMLAKLSLGQSDDIYPALVEVLQKGDESNIKVVLDDLEFLLYASTVSKLKFMRSDGLKPLLDVVPVDDERLSRQAMATLVAFLTDLPEGVQAAIDVGAVAILEAKEDPDDIFDRKNNAINLLETLKDAPAIKRIEFTPEAYAAFGKTLSDPGAMEQLIRNLESSQDEKQLAVAGGLLSVFADMLRSSSDPTPVLKALHVIFVADGVILSGVNLPARAAERCGIPDALKPLTESKDETIQEDATRVLGAIVIKQDTEGEEDKGNDEEGNENYGKEDQGDEPTDDRGGREESEVK